MSGTSNRKRNFLILLIIILIVMLISATYAYFLLLVSKEDDSTELYTGTFDVQYTQGNIIYEQQFYPRSTPVSLNDTNNTYINSFSVTNTGSLDGLFNIKLDVSTNEFLTDDLKYNIYNNDGQIFISGSVSESDSYVLANNILLKAEESSNYTIQIWLEETGKQQNLDANRRLTAAIEIDGKQYVE